MCGISGWLMDKDCQFSKPQLQSMVTMLAHRGPDNSGIFIDQDRGIGLGHNRLSIIDLSENAKQPMLNRQSGSVLSFNGEIYNYREVRVDLEKHGYHFHSNSDTEVLLYALEEWGTKCLDIVKGMYAFAYWDNADSSLLLVRDPMGVKPLYYTSPGNCRGVVFASEIKALLDLPSYRKELSKKALRQYLEFGYSFDENDTMFEGIKKIPPGCFLKIDRNKQIRIEKYFHPNVVSSSTDSSAELQEKLFSTLETVVKQQLISDVPVGLLLSGGLDSSIIAAVASRNCQLKTFSFGYAESSIDERSKASAVSKYLGTEHEEFMISPNEVMQNLENAVGCMDDLFADWGVFSTRIMYRKCRERGIKVVLVGEGADELFAGYWSRFSPGLEDMAPKTMDWVLFNMYRTYTSRRYGGSFFAFRRIMKSYLNAVQGNLFDAIRLFESRNQLSNNYVMKVDKASMSESVEARVPFLDSRVAEIAYQIPGRMLIDKGTQTKMLLREMAKNFKLLPSEVLETNKFGIAIPPEWISNSDAFNSYAKEIVLDGGGWTENLGYDKAMKQYFNNSKSGFPFPSALGIFRVVAWRLLLLNLWSRHYDVDPVAV